MVSTFYSWAVPTEEAIATIRAFTPRIVEIGAGSGYWAWLLAQAGVDVVAYDRSPPPATWYPVLPGTHEAVVRHPDRSLFLCWPPWGETMALDALRLYAGDQVVYVGEWMGGSAEPDFFRALAAGFRQVASVTIPQWFMRSDSLTIHRRRPPPERAAGGGAASSGDRV